MKAQSPSEPRKFISDVVWVAISRISILLTGLVTLPALTKSYSSEVYGIWSQTLVTVGFLSTILTLRFETSVVRFLAGEESTEKRRRALGTMLWPLLVFASLVLIISTLLIQDMSLLLFNNPKYVSLVPVTFIWVAIQALFSFSLSYLRARGNIKRISVIQLAFATLQMAVIVVLARSQYSLGQIITYIIIGQAFLIAVLFGMIVKDIGIPKPALEGLRRYLALSVPMIPSVFLMWIINASDRYFITHLLNVSETGIYSASYTLASMVSLFYIPISFVLFPTLSRLWEQKELLRVRNYLEHSIRLFLAIAIPATAGLSILSQPLLSILTTTEYMAGGGLVLLVAVGTIFLGIYQMNVFIIPLIQQTKWLLLIIAVAVATNVGINIALIPVIGIMGAAISTIVSYFLLATIVTAWAARIISYRMDFKFLSKVVAATLLMALCLWFIRVDSALSIILAVITGVIVFSLGFLLLRPLSKQDKMLIMETLTTLNLWARGLICRHNLPADHGQGQNEGPENDQ